MAEPLRVLLSPGDVPNSSDGASPASPVGEAGGRAHRGLLAAIVDSSEDAIISQTLDGIITSWNPSAERLFGYPAEDIVGRPARVLLASGSRDELPGLMARLGTGERIEPYDAVRVTRDGRRLTLSLTLSPIHDDTGRIIGASTIGRDITGRTAEADGWRLLSEIGQALTELLDPEELLRNLADRLVRDMADYSITYLLEDDRIRRVGAAHADPAQRGLVQRLVSLAPPSLHDTFGAGAVIRTGEAVLAPIIPAPLLEEVSGGGEYLEILRALAPVSTIILPLRARGRIVGAVSLVATARSNRRYSETDLLLGRELADRAGLALDNARLYDALRTELSRRETAEESLRRGFGQLRVLYEMAEAVGRAGALEEIYERALDGLSAGLGVDRASILLFDPDGVMRFKAWRGLSDSYRRAVEGHSPWAPDTRDPAPILIPDVSADSTLDEALRRTIVDEGIRAMTFIPLVSGGRLLGKFMLYSDEPRRVTDEEVELAQTIAGTIAVAIARKGDELSIRQAKEAAESANQAKSQFLGMMSHELRTPLNAVLGYAELLLLETKGGINAAQRTQLERILASAKHQLELVEELLAYTRLEATREEARLIQTDARRVVGEVAELMGPQASSKGLRLTLQLSEEPASIITDPPKLRQVVLNLVDNAIKYTDEGEIFIELRRAEDRLVLEVRDTGAGIPPDKLEYIFEPFARADETLTRATAGTGLGLAIARRIAHLLGGNLRVRSTLGHGSTFILDLPHPVSAPSP